MTAVTDKRYGGLKLIGVLALALVALVLLAGCFSAGQNSDGSWHVEGQIDPAPSTQPAK